MEIYYFDLNHAINTHDIIIAESGDSLHKISIFVSSSTE